MPVTFTPSTLRTSHAPEEQVSSSDGDVRVCQPGEPLVHVGQAPTPDRQPPRLELAHHNAARVLEALGFVTPDQQAAGECDAVDFLGWILLALASHQPIAQPAELDDATGAGQAARYLTDRLQRLHDVALWAVFHGREITWT